MHISYVQSALIKIRVVHVIFTITCCTIYCMSLTLIVVNVILCVFMLRSVFGWALCGVPKTHVRRGDPGWSRSYSGSDPTPDWVLRTSTIFRTEIYSTVHTKALPSSRRTHPAGKAPRSHHYNTHPQHCPSDSLRKRTDSVWIDYMLYMCFSHCWKRIVMFVIIDTLRFFLSMEWVSSVNAL